MFLATAAPPNKEAKIAVLANNFKAIMAATATPPLAREDVLFMIYP